VTLPLSEGGRRVGFLPSPPDARDYGISSFSRYLTVSSAPGGSVDLERWCGPVKDQKDLGACTAFAGTGMREFLARKYQEQAAVLSPLYLYYKERELDGDLMQGDTGSYGRTAVKALNQFGVCLETQDAYVYFNFQIEPTAEQATQALAWKSGTYHALQNVSDMRSCLASGYVFCLGFRVYSSFEGKWRDGVTMPVPDRSKEQVLGGHEVLAIGYSDERAAFKIRNSWGPSFADGGNFWMPYSVAANPEIVNEAWIQHQGHAWS